MLCYAIVWMLVSFVSIYPIRGKATWNRYKVLPAHFIPMKEYFYSDGGLFKDDNEYENYVNPMLWPLHSPDTNPVKHL